jgi:hypothetical protein
MLDHDTKYLRSREPNDGSKNEQPSCPMDKPAPSPTAKLGRRSKTKYYEDWKEVPICCNKLINARVDVVAIPGHSLFYGYP